MDATPSSKKGIHFSLAPLFRALSLLLKEYTTEILRHVREHWKKPTVSDNHLTQGLK
jgi:hypothetical protein